MHLHQHRHKITQHRHDTKSEKVEKILPAGIKFMTTHVVILISSSQMCGMTFNRHVRLYGTIT